MKAEQHFVHRTPWLRAAVLGANDGIISTTSLILGFVAAHSDPRTILLSGLAGLGAGALSMASGEYVSVSSQTDTEKADLKREKRELQRNFESETQELADIYVNRGLSENLAREVATQLMAKDPLGAHAREELGIVEGNTAKPLQAAMASAASFSIGASCPLLAVVLLPSAHFALGLFTVAILVLIALGFVSARIGGASPVRAVVRITIWGTLAMAVTSGIGLLSTRI